MLNFTRRDQQQGSLLALRAWAFWGVILPVAIPLGFALLLGGCAALLGAPALDLALDFLTDSGTALYPLILQIWITTYFLAAICYGVGRQLISQTARHPLSAPLALLAARLRQWVARRVSSLCTIASTSGPISKVSLAFPTDSVGLAPPVALLSGSAPRLE